MVEVRVYTGGDEGSWDVTSCEPVVGEGLPTVRRVAVARRTSLPPHTPPPGASWALHGTASHLRYTTARERATLSRLSPPLGRPEATVAALIPITMTRAWWDLAQDERRAVLEERSHHIAIGRSYLPAVARELSHSRELGEPFDFLTWFEYSPADAGAFEELVARLRASPEWEYVDREVDLRLVRRAAPDGS